MSNKNSWNWGAAGLTVIWGLYHKVWISLLMFVPIVNAFWWLILGVKGNEWAWQKNKGKRWQTYEEFLKSQEKWKPWSIFAIGFMFTFIYVGYLIIMFYYTFYFTDFFLKSLNIN